MTRKPKRGKPTRGALIILGFLFFSSGVIRLAGGTGLAVARELETLGADSPLESHAKVVAGQSCEPAEDIALALQTLRHRSSALDEREKQIDLRMAVLKDAEGKLEREMAALVSAEKSLSATISLADGAAESDVARLIAMYEKMKPKDAAALFDTMDSTFAAGFLARMRPEIAAEVLAGLPPEKAYAVSVILAGRNMDVPTE